MKSDRVYLLHIRDAIQLIQEYTKDGREEFMAVRMIQDAVIRNIEVIGEAVKNISSDVKKQNHEIQWKRIAGMRDKLIHEYFGVNLLLVWEVVERELPEFKKSISKILQSQ
jgi:uncharacterized protein with HEPN domain